MILFSFFLEKSHLEKAESNPALLTTSETIPCVSMSAVGGKADMDECTANVR